jgi:O-antigen/teichoic acid export membrane protein
MRIAAQLSAVIAGALSTLFLVRGLDDGEFGRFATVFALVMIVNGLSDLGLSTVGVAEWVRRPASERRPFLADLIGARIVISIVASAIAFGTALALEYTNEMLLAAAIGFAGITVSSVASALSVPLIAELRQGRVAVADAIRTAGLSVLQIVFVLAGSGLVPLLAATIPMAIVSTAVILLGVRDVRTWPSFSPTRIIALLRESVAFAAASAVSVVYLRSSMLVVPLVATAAQTDHFAVAFRAVEVLSAVPALLTGALFPLLAHAAANDRARLAGGFVSLWRSSVALGVVVAGLVAGGAPLAVIVLSGGAPDDAVDSLAILGGAVGSIFIGSAAMWVLLAEKAYRAVLLINICALAANVGLTLLGTELFGPPGAAVALLACEIGIAATATLIVVRRLRVREARGLALQAARGLVALSIGGAVFVLTGDETAWLPLLSVPAATTATLVALRGVPRELLALARSVAARVTNAGGRS